QAGRQLELAWHDGARWRMLPVAVMTTQVGAHVDAGFLRLTPVSAASEGASEDVAATPDAGDETATTAGSESSRPLAKAGDVPSVSAQVALRLASGRVLGTRVHALDATAIVLGLPHPSALAEGTLLEVAWSVGPKWYSLGSTVAQAGGDGLLRLLPSRVASEQKNRRSEARYRVALELRIRVEQGRTLRAGTDLRAKTEDVSLGGVSFTVEADVAIGDILKLTVLGPEGQIGNDTRGRIVRATRRPGAVGMSVGVAFDHPPGALTSALRRIIWSQG
ncbi:MAG: PilZ domain-containing protein, partial [Gaiellales bacterium]